MIPIPQTLYEQYLTDWLYEKKFQEDTSKSGQSEIELLYRLSKAQMLERDRGEEYPFIENIHPDNDETAILSQYVDSDNIQVKAFVNDVLRHSAKDKRQYAVAASDAYLELAPKISSPWFLLRSVTVRSIKQLMTSDYLQRLCDVIDKMFYSYWIAQIAKELRKSYDTERLRCFEDVVTRHMQIVNDKSHRDDERNCLDALYEIGALSLDEWHLQKAQSFENELDYVNSHKAQNTIYPNNVGTIQEAYNEIYPVRKTYQGDYERIKEKLQKEQKTFHDALTQYGIKTVMKVPEEFIKGLDRSLETAKMDNYLDALVYLASFPFPKDSDYERYCKASVEASPMSSFFGMGAIGDKGQNIGKAEPEEGVKIYAHQYVRLSLTYMVAHVLNKVSTKTSATVDDESIAAVLSECNSSYISPDRLPLWVKGIIAGLHGDFIVASHLLMPQIEHSLALKAESYAGSLTALHNEAHQDEPSLAKTLEVLKPYMSESLNDEFRFFLNTGADVNCRNNLAHGLWSAEQCEHYGQYLWWLAVKLFFREKELFKEDR